VDALKAVEDFGQNALRYYLLSILPEATDSSFIWEQLQAKVNNELANNIGNFLNRCLKFTQKNWADGMPAAYYEGFSGSEYGKELVSDLAELRGLIDQYQVKKGIEKVMNIGQKANNFFSDNAPWAQIKTDKDAAGKTLAHSSLYALCLGVALEPFLPSLSASILNHFENVLTADSKMKIYNGELTHLDELFKNGHQLTEKVEALVPKIDDSLITQMLENLKTE
jgi:methionyl-tRNA synthetase